MHPPFGTVGPNYAIGIGVILFVGLVCVAAGSVAFSLSFILLRWWQTSRQPPSTRR